MISLEQRAVGVAGAMVGVIPAEAGISSSLARRLRREVPAFAGMTVPLGDVGACD